VDDEENEKDFEVARGGEAAVETARLDEGEDWGMAGADDAEGKESSGVSIVVEDEEEDSAAAALTADEEHGADDAIASIRQSDAAGESVRGVSDREDEDDEEDERDVRDAGERVGASIWPLSPPFGCGSGTCRLIKRPERGEEEEEEEEEEDEMPLPRPLMVGSEREDMPGERCANE